MGEDAKKVQGRGQLFNFREKWQGLRHSSGWPWILMFIREVRVQRLERSSGFEDETSHSNDPRGGKLLQPWKQLRVNIPILKSPDIPLCLLPCSIITQQFLSVLLSCFLRYCSSCWHSLPLWLWAVFLRFNLLWDTHCSWRLNSIWTAWIIMLCLSTDWIRLNPPPPPEKKPSFILRPCVCDLGTEASGKRMGEERAVTLVLMNKPYLWQRMGRLV